MPRKNANSPNPEYDFLSIRVTDFSICLDCGISYEIREEKKRRDDMQVISHGTHIELCGTCTYPIDRVDHAYQISIYSGTHHEESAKSLVKDYRAYDEKYQPMWKKVRGQQMPVHNIPPGIGYLDKRRGEEAWQSAMFIESRATTDMLTLLGRIEPLFISIHEMKLGRQRWIVGFTLQTTDPAEE